MITHLQIEFLEAGQLGVFDKPAGLPVWHLGDVTPTTAGTWRQSEIGNRIMVSTTMDIALAELGDRLRTKLAELPDMDGSVLFCIQAAYNLDRIAAEQMTLVDTSASTSGDFTIDTSTANPAGQTITVSSNASAATGSVVISSAYPLDPMNPPRGPMRVADPVGTWVLGGMVFVPDHEMGTRLTADDDAVTIIEQGCRAFMESHEPGLHDAIAAGAMRYHDPANPRHEFPMGEPMSDAVIAESIARRHGQREKARNVTAKARKLLMVCLTPYQRFEFLEYGEFHVAGLDGYTYVIRERFGHNVFRIEDGDQTWEYCLVTENWGVPKFDLMLAQKLLLEREPAAFFEKANAWRLME